MKSDYERPVNARYLDPVEVVWYATAARLGLRVRRNPSIFSMTDGTGLLELGPKNTLDADDCTAQMIFHELCHWITNGLETFELRDWGFPLEAELDWREHSCLRLQAHLADSVGLRKVLAPTSGFRQYYDALGGDLLAPLPGWPHEDLVVQRAAEAIARAQLEPWGQHLRAALAATAALSQTVQPFLTTYCSDIEADELPSLWSRQQR